MIDATTDFPRRLRRPRAAAYMGVTPTYLARLACEGGGPPYIRLGAKMVIYERDDLDVWLAAHRVRSAAEYSERKRRARAEQSEAATP